jgi:hypothetical protein
VITLGFYRPRGIIGRIVSIVTGSPFCHVVVNHTVNGIPMVAQAHQQYGTCTWRADRVDQPDFCFPVPWITDEWFFGWLSLYLGSAYDWRDILAFGFRFRHPPGRHQLICSELVARMLVDASRELPVPCDWDPVIEKLRTQVPGGISPGALFDLLQLAVKV